MEVSTYLALVNQRLEVQGVRNSPSILESRDRFEFSAFSFVCCTLYSCMLFILFLFLFLCYSCLMRNFENRRSIRTGGWNCKKFARLEWTRSTNIPTIVSPYFLIFFCDGDAKRNKNSLSFFLYLSIIEDQENRKIYLKMVWCDIECVYVWVCQIFFVVSLLLRHW